MGATTDKTLTVDSSKTDYILASVVKPCCSHTRESLINHTANQAGQKSWSIKKPQILTTSDGRPRHLAGCPPAESPVWRHSWTRSNVCLGDPGTRRLLCCLSPQISIHHLFIPTHLKFRTSPSPRHTLEHTLWNWTLRSFNFFFLNLFLGWKIIEVESSICPTLLFQLLLFSG